MTVAIYVHTDRLFALPRLKQGGAFLTTTEGVLLQLVQDAKHPNCKELKKKKDGFGLLGSRSSWLTPPLIQGLLAFFSSLVYTVTHHTLQT